MTKAMFAFSTKQANHWWLFRGHRRSTDLIGKSVHVESGLQTSTSTEKVFEVATSEMFDSAVIEMSL